MRKEQVVTRILRDIAHLIAEEAAVNQPFAAKLDAIIGELGQRKKAAIRRVRDHDVPDIFEAAAEKNDEEIEMWLSGLDIATLKAIIRKHDFDTSKRTQRWREPTKFAKLITEQRRARLRRGSAFLGSGSGPMEAS
jgi:hypothetical protein